MLEHDFGLLAKIIYNLPSWNKKIHLDGCGVTSYRRRLQKSPDYLAEVLAVPEVREIYIRRLKLKEVNDFIKQTRHTNDDEDMKHFLNPSPKLDDL